MSRVNSFGVRNLRSFGSEKQLIPIKKINILVGRNSCGKSTFLRTYPLIRQSIESNTRSPILWYGSYVDFGNISTAINDDAEKVFFDFDVSLDIAQKASEEVIIEHTLDIETRRKSGFSKFPASLSIGLQPKDKRVESTTDIIINDTDISICYIGSSVEYVIFTYAPAKGNEHSKLSMKFSDLYLLGKSSIMPLRIMGTKDVKEGTKTFKTIVRDHLKDAALKELAVFFKPYCQTAGKTLYSKLEKLSLSNKDELDEQLRKAFKSDKLFGEKYQQNQEELIANTLFYLTIIQLDDILLAADKCLKDLFSSVRYLGPVRASAERFYRHQDLEIGEIDHKGENLPMVINSLESRTKKQLSQWIFENFGFELDLETSGLHYELKIKEENDSKFHNISDMGFGYSQILPVIVSIWLETQNKNQKNHFPFAMKTNRTLVIEQPELHLHPALQYKFGIAIAKVCKLASERGFKIVMETHSSQLIEALGDSIRSGVLTDQDINISLFEKNSSDCTEVTQSGFDAEGYLTNWPTGFLSA
ncbi:AAA family ATPase [Pseudomonas brenneri]